MVTLAASAQAAQLRKRSRAESLSHDQRLEALALLAQEYPAEAVGGYFGEPVAIDPVVRVVRGANGGPSITDLSWPSNYQTFVSHEDVLERIRRHHNNGIAAARLFSWGASRPVAILIHGYLAGPYALEQRVWPIDWFGRLGLDIALFVLPYHGIRADPDRRGPPPFPGADPRMSNEGFRQAIVDLRNLIRWLKERGHPAVGVMGMSLGGYTTALAATAERELAFAVPIIPLASIADFARDQGRLGSTPRETALQHRALENVYRVVSPLHREPLLPPDRILVIGAKNDQITPFAHAQRLARHFQAPLATLPGGHLIQVGRSSGFRRIGRMLGNLGLTAPRNYGH